MRAGALKYTRQTRHHRDAFRTSNEDVTQGT